MNDTISLLFATSLLAVSGLGLYMYNSNGNQLGGTDCNEDNYQDDELDINNEEVYKPKIRSRGKTKRNKKSGGTKRRY